MLEKKLQDATAVKKGRGGIRKRGGPWKKQQGQNLCLSCDKMFTYKIHPLDDPKVQRRCNRCKMLLRNSESN